MLRHEKDIEQTWGSHKPILQAVMEVVKPQSVIECGCGYYSSPIIDSADRVLTIEHDLSWGESIKKEFPDRDWLLHGFNNVHNGIRRPELTGEALVEIDSFYEGLVLEHADFLFVDTFASARVPAMIHLPKFADIVLLHDLEPNSPEFYCYDEFTMDGWHHYRFAPEGWVNEIHRIPWTDLYSREPLPSLQAVIDREANKLWGLTAILEKIDGC